QRLHQSGVLAEDRLHLARDRLVAREVRRHEYRLRAQPLGPRRRHRRTYAVASRLVGGRAHDRPWTAPGHHHRAAAQRRIVALLHRGVERVHVDVDDLAHARWILGARAPARATPQREPRRMTLMWPLGSSTATWISS